MDVEKFNELIGNLKKPESFDVLFGCFYPKIVKHIFFKFRRRDLGEDVAQEFFMNLFNRGAEGYVECPLHWIFVSCENIAKDYIAEEKKYDSFFTEEENEDGKQFENLLFGEYRKKLRELDESSRDIITMHLYEGYTLKEVSEVLELNYNNVRQKFSRGINKLKAKL